ncbi:MAG: hypothetical protein A3C03_01755 [Candidatus Colwellbacteria bacterium RIFCSPHIGHO2_02_FULL_45_17]|uniref:DNA-3-methyladenine glycosylase II n=1 Tax=Candidatus Colwellbacteria bacterium RIFCSPLOWO2_12_FULL_46_17 TaxID=1797695 RepID=A0A1G1ZD78_9BACT|nr:MAG: hypothetical protein A3C03_01755 [Candidatus Colwellbacteria bacterium RIFCSPHIGHO2_02_FULL_45_17]OGY62548.1 MAG: hypothetical protein A3G58_01775 [Candidatus Colwellbacteria bacterium RIFCSPLOWO2_12_FULL_46_17]
MKRTSPARVKAHFKEADPKIYVVLKSVNFNDWYKEPKGHGDYFVHLCYEIISQQLSGKAASTIIKRFEELFPKKRITAEKLAKIPDKKLRAVGMSWSKASFLKDLAGKTIRKEIGYSKLHEMTDEDVTKELTQVKGIGPWTAEMFLMFALGREDVFSHADQGLRNGMKRVYRLKEIPDAKKADKITAKWKPYRSYGCFALWHSVDS